MTAEETRESIASYLEMVAKTEVGSLLNEKERELVDFCAAWVRNELDLKSRGDRAAERSAENAGL